MYDPEFNRQVQNFHDNFKADTPFLNSLQNALRVLHNQYNDYENCFDPEKKEELRKEGSKMTLELKNLIKLLNRKT